MPVIPLHNVRVKSVVAVVKKISYSYMLACKLLLCPSKLVKPPLVFTLMSPPFNFSFLGVQSQMACLF
jgi:hypothetical protein